MNDQDIFNQARIALDDETGIRFPDKYLAPFLLMANGTFGYERMPYSKAEAGRLISDIIERVGMRAGMTPVVNLSADILAPVPELSAISCFFFHRWGRWTQYLVNYQDAPTSSWRYEERQKRTCERCGKVQDERVKRSIW